MPTRWKPDMESKLTGLVTGGSYTYPEIAQQMSLTRLQIATKASRLGLKNGAYLKRITKHAHLREKAMRYFLTHTFCETCAKFGLTNSELRSLMTVGYRDPSLAHLRKDTRRHDLWTLEETLFLLRHAGVRERGWIAKKINRAGARNIKERVRSWNAATKCLNGMPRKWAVEIWGNRVAIPSGIKTKAGPSGAGGNFRFVIIPWHECLRLSEKYPTPAQIKSGIRAMVRFQEFIHGTKSPASIRRRINQSLGAR